MRQQKRFGWKEIAVWLAACACIAAAGARILTLSGGTAVARAAVLVVLAAEGALAAALLLRSCRGLPAAWVVLAVAVVFLLRALCFDYQSGDYRQFLSAWADFFRENGGFRAISKNIGDYNVPYLYFMAAISYLGVPDLYCIKLFSILFDVFLAWGCLRVVRLVRGERRSSAAETVVFLAALALPTVVLNGAYWGQCDSIYAALTVHALALLMEKRPAPSLVLLAFAFSFKLQTIFLLPLWGAAWLAGQVKFRQLFVFPAAYLGSILPALLMGKPLRDILGVYFNQMGEYSSLTLNAPSVFQFVPYGMQVNETLFARLGIAAAAVLALAAVGAGVLLRNRLDPAALLSMGAVLAIGVPFFLPHMHERYFFLADLLTLCLACTAWRRIPACVLAAGSSLACYFVYLRLKYNCVLKLGPYYFSMALEAVAMLAALVLVTLYFFKDINNRKAKRLDGGNGI